MYTPCSKNFLLSSDCQTLTNFQNPFTAAKSMNLLQKYVVFLQRLNYVAALPWEVKRSNLLNITTNAT